MDIKRNGSQPSRTGSTGYFTVIVRIDPLFEAPDPARVFGANVTFEPGADQGSFTKPSRRADQDKRVVNRAIELL